MCSSVPLSISALLSDPTCPNLVALKRFSCFDCFWFSPRSSSPDFCCGFGGSGSHPWPVSGPSPVWTGPPCQAGCTCPLVAALQEPQRTCTADHSPTTWLSVPQRQLQKRNYWTQSFHSKYVEKVSSSKVGSMCLSSFGVRVT